MNYHPPITPARPSDEELYTLLQVAHGIIHQHTTLTGSHRPYVAQVQRRLKAAWEGLRPTKG